MAGDFSQDALILVAHGSSENTKSSELTRTIVEFIRAQSIFSEVACAFKLEEPKIEEATDLVNSKRVFVVPLTISEGWFTEEIIPFQLGLRSKDEVNFLRKGTVAGKELIYCKPVGTHLMMPDIIIDKAVDIVRHHPFPHEPRPDETTLIIAGHGTQQNTNSRKAIEAQVELIRARDEYAEVLPAFMEEMPLITDCYKNTQSRYIVIVPFFISDGQHTVEDIPVLLGEPATRVKERLEAGQPTWRNPTERKGKLLWYTDSIGSAPQLPDIILDLVSEPLR